MYEFQAKPCVNVVCLCLYAIKLFIYNIGAVHRYYESRRRLFNDSQPSRVEKAHESKQKIVAKKEGNI